MRRSPNARRSAADPRPVPATLIDALEPRVLLAAAWGLDAYTPASVAIDETVESTDVGGWSANSKPGPWSHLTIAGEGPGADPNADGADEDAEALPSWLDLWSPTDEPDAQLSAAESAVIAPAPTTPPAPTHTTPASASTPASTQGTIRWITTFPGLARQAGAAPAPVIASTLLAH